jgi:hypothetical protein
MEKQSPRLFKLAVKYPCLENWNDMQPTQQGGFCAACQKDVVNFSAMTDKQIVDFFANYKGGGLCGKINQSQQGKTYPIGKPIKLTYSRQIWKIAAISIGLISNLSQPLFAQTADNQHINNINYQQNPNPDINLPEKTYPLNVQFFAKSGGKKVPLHNTSVEIVQLDGTIIAETFTDDNGKISVDFTKNQWQKGLYVRSAVFKNREKGYFIATRYQLKDKIITISAKNILILPPPIPEMQELMGFMTSPHLEEMYEIEPIKEDKTLKEKE